MMKNHSTTCKSAMLVCIALLLSTFNLRAQVPSDLMENCNQWKITYPDGTEDKTLCGEANNEYFHVDNSGNAIVFFAPIRSNNGTTPNSSYIRSELREREPDGSKDVYWTTSGSHMVYVKQAITHLPMNKSHLVATQIHGNKSDGIDDAMVMRLENSHLFLSFNGGQLRSDLTIKTNYNLGDIHEVIFLVVDGMHYCYYSEDGNLLNAYNSGNASAYLVKDGSNDHVMNLNYDQSYFKIGNYTQSNPDREGSDTDDPNNYGEVYVYDFTVRHGTDPGQTVDVTGVSLSPSSASLAIGGTQQLSAAVSPSNATNQGVSYSSNNTSVATVSSSGLVTAVSEGSATITVTTTDGGYTDTSNITVFPPPSGSNLALNKTVTGTGNPDGANVPANLVDGDPDSRWSVSGFPQSATVDLGAVFSIDGTELVCYNDRAYQYIIEASTNGSSYTTVVNRSNNTTPGTNTSPITDSFSPVDARYVRITVSGAASYTGSWVSLEELRVFGAEGSSNVAVTGVSVTPGSVSLDEGNTQQLSASVSPSDATDQSVTWSTSNSSVATVSSSGLVTAMSAGSATITATTNDGSFTDTSNVTVTSTANSAPYDIPKFQAYLAECKLQSPGSGTEATQADIINGYSSNTFYVADGDKIGFYQTGASARTELRFLDNWLVSDGDQTFHANLNIVQQTCDQVTVMQIHDDANVGSGPNKPLIRIYKSISRSPGNHLWAAVKTDAGGVATQHIDLGAAPGGYFDCDISIIGGNMIVSVNGVEHVNMDVSFWTFPSYWKNGVYLQDAGEATAYFNELTLTVHGSGTIANLALNKPVTVTSQQSSNPGPNLVDDDPDSRWSASGFPQSATIDLGANYSISSTELVCFSDRAYQYVIEASTNGSSYSTIVDRSSNTTHGSNSSPISDSFTPVNARYVRISVSGADGYSGSWVSLEELRVFGDPAGARTGSLIESQEVQTDWVSAYPVPMRDQLTVEFGESAPYVALDLVDMAGRQYWSGRQIRSNKISLDVDALPKGVYLLRLYRQDASIQVIRVSK